MTRTMEVVRAAVSADRRLVAPVSGAVMAIPVVGIFVIGSAFGSTRAAVSMAIGANLVAVVALVGAPRLPISLAVVDALAVGVSVVVGALSVGTQWLHVLLLVLWCFLAGILVSVGRVFGAIGTQAIIGFVVLGRFEGSVHDAFELGALALLGGTAEIIALLALRGVTNLRAPRVTLSAGFSGLAELARGDPATPSIRATTALDAAEEILSVPALFGRVDVSDLNAALVQARRARLELTTLAGIRVRLGADGATRVLDQVNVLLELVAITFDAIAHDVVSRRPNRDWERSAGDLKEALAAFRMAIGPPTSPAEVLAAQCADELASLGGQLRAAGSAIDRARSVEPARPPAERSWTVRPGGPDHLGFDGAVLLLDLRTDSVARRHAIRLAVAVPASALLASVLSLPHGYWVPLAVALILKPDYATLLGNGVSRILGTLLGVVVAAVGITVLGPDLAISAVLVALTAWVAYSVWPASLAFGYAGVTATILILLSVSLPNPTGIAGDRLLDIAIGGAIAVVSYLVWPTDPSVVVLDAHAEVFSALRTYVDVVLTLIEGDAVPPGTIRDASRALRVSWGNAEMVVAQSIEEPGSTTVEAQRGRALLEAELRIIRATHALRFEAERGSVVPRGTSISVLRTSINEVLDDIASAHLDRVDARSPSLRTVCDEADRMLSDAGAPQTIGLHLDEMVNAINTSVHVRSIVT